ncbi:manganese efflux pump MntP family protein [Candidatus Micrarchaeota archaeon]|nr:manganese efflux pump MntP family protein [Candidatus Micrarchaeota archaeon]
MTALLIGVGLAMDSAAVSMTGGANAKQGKLAAAALLAALIFGGFQGIMLFLGGLGGEGLRGMVSEFDHWVAFILLAVVGGKMLLESCHSGEDKKVNLLDARILLILAVATSIDSLAVGVGVAFADHSLLETAIIVGAATALISFSSVFIGSRFGCRLEGKAGIFGGVVLILIGLNILRTHMAL